mgnify:CR=1 FL=1
MTGAADEIELGAGEVACKIGGKSSGDFKSMPLQSLIVSYFTTLGTISIMGGSSEQLEMIQEFVKANDRKQPQAYLEVSILELNESGSKELQNTWKYISQNFSFNAADGTSSIGSPFPIFFRGDSYDNYTDITSSPSLKESSFVLNSLSGKTLEFRIEELKENPPIDEYEEDINEKYNLMYYIQLCSLGGWNEQ